MVMSVIVDRLKRLYLLTSLLVLASTFLTPTLVSAAQNRCNSNTFLGIKPWNQYLEYDDNCNLKDGFDKSKIAILISFAIVDILLRIAGTVAFALIVYSGFKFVLSQGNPEKEKQAREAVINALIGLVISIMAVGVVSFIGNQLK